MEESYFDRLPAEVIVYIIEKIPDEKSLCMCFSVSKLFAALVVQTRVISVKVDSLPWDSRWRKPASLNLLEKLSCLEFVKIECTNPLELEKPVPLLSWKSDSSDFILVSAKSRIDDATGINPMLEATQSVVSYADALLNPVFKHISHSRKRFAFTKFLFDLIPKLKHICVVDSTEQGSIVWEEDFARRINEMPLKDSCVKLWAAPLVKLSSSGCAMKDAVLISIRPVSHEINCCFQEEEFSELAATMIKEYHCKEVSSMPPVGVNFEATSSLFGLLLSI